MYILKINLKIKSVTNHQYNQVESIQMNLVNVLIYQITLMPKMSTNLKTFGIR